MNYYPTTQFNICGRRAQHISCNHRIRSSFNHGFTADLILAPIQNDTVVKKQTSYKIDCYYKPEAISNSLLVKIQNRNLIPVFVGNMPLVDAVTQFYVRPRYMILGCVNGPKRPWKDEHFHQQFVFKMCYRCSDLLILLQVFGDDNSTMEPTMIVNGIDVTLTITESTRYCAEYLMGTAECIEHYSHAQTFLSLFRDKDGSATEKLCICFQFEWLNVSPKVIWYPLKYDPTKSNGEIVANKERLISEECHQNSSICNINEQHTSINHIHTNPQIEHVTTQPIHNYQPYADIDTSSIVSNATNMEPPKKKKKCN